MISSLHIERTFDNVQYPFVMKTSGNGRNIPQCTKAIHDRPIAINALHMESPKAFSLK